MRQETIKVYTFDELSAESKQVALDKKIDNADMWIIDDWYEYIYEWTIEKLEKIGITTSKTLISFEGFYSQGGYAQIEASIYAEDLEKFARSQKVYTKYKKIIELCKLEGGETWFIEWATLSNRSDDTIPTNEYIEGEGWSPDIVKEYYKLMELVSIAISKEVQELYKALMNEYEYITSPAYIAEELIAGGYEFLEDGSAY